MNTYLDSPKQDNITDKNLQVLVENNSVKEIAKIQDEYKKIVATKDQIIAVFIREQLGLQGAEWSVISPYIETFKKLNKLDDESSNKQKNQINKGNIYLFPKSWFKSKKENNNKKNEKKEYQEVFTSNKKLFKAVSKYLIEQTKNERIELDEEYKRYPFYVRNNKLNIYIEGTDILLQKGISQTPEELENYLNQLEKIDRSNNKNIQKLNNVYFNHIKTITVKLLIKKIKDGTDIKEEDKESPFYLEDGKIKASINRGKDWAYLGENYKCTQNDVDDINYIFAKESGIDVKINHLEKYFDDYPQDTNTARNKAFAKINHFALRSGYSPQIDKMIPRMVDFLVKGELTQYNTLEDMKNDDKLITVDTNNTQFFLRGVGTNTNGFNKERCLLREETNKIMEELFKRANTHIKENFGFKDDYEVMYCVSSLTRDIAYNSGGMTAGNDGRAGSVTSSHTTGIAFDIGYHTGKYEDGTLKNIKLRDKENKKEIAIKHVDIFNLSKASLYDVLDEMIKEGKLFVNFEKHPPHIHLMHYQDNLSKTTTKEKGKEIAKGFDKSYQRRHGRSYYEQAIQN